MYIAPCAPWCSHMGAVGHDMCRVISIGAQTKSLSHKHPTSDIMLAGNNRIHDQNGLKIELLGGSSSHQGPLEESETQPWGYDAIFYGQGSQWLPRQDIMSRFWDENLHQKLPKCKIVLLAHLMENLMAEISSYSKALFDRQYKKLFWYYSF